jgi:hypothetical protein
MAAYELTKRTNVCMLEAGGFMISDSRFTNAIKETVGFSGQRCFFKFRSFGDFSDAAWGGQLENLIRKEGSDFLVV